MVPLLTSCDQLLGLRVRVYRNLHNGLFSVLHRGRVIAYLPGLSLSGVSFRVQPAGRAKVLATRSKFVHAFVCGTVAPRVELSAPDRVSYNPYRASTFTFADGAPATQAARAEINATGIWVR